MEIISVNMLLMIKLLVFVAFVFAYQGSSVFEGSKLCNFITRKNYNYEAFFALSDVNDSQPAGYYAKLPISVITEFGNIYIIMCETDALLDNNRCYEFGLRILNTSSTEIRRKDSVHESFKFVKRELLDMEETDTKVSIELSVSDDGVIKLLDLNTQFEIQMKDTTDVIPVKYIAFASFQGCGNSFTFNCSNVLHSKEDERSDKINDVISIGFVLVSTWAMCIFTFLATFQLYRRLLQ